MRVFLAIEIPGRIQRDLARIQRDLELFLPGVRWEKPEKLHLTLVFLGKVDGGRIGELEEAVREGLKARPPASRRRRVGRGVKGINVGFDGMGFFPKRRPRVVLLEIGEGREEIEKLQKRLAEALSEAKFEFARLSRPHVTLGRFKKGLGDRVEGLGPSFAKAAEGISFEVKETVIVESKLHPAGAIHTPLARVPL